MANKQTIQDIDEAIERWHRRLTMAVRKIDELRAKRKRIRLGKLKQPEPAGVKVMFSARRDAERMINDDIEDICRPVAPGGMGPC